jgi:hypothetical protein
MGPTATTHDLLRVPRCPVCSEVTVEVLEPADEAASAAAPSAAGPQKDEPAKDAAAGQEKSEALPLTATESAA